MSQILYKYTKIEYVIDAIRNGIFAAKLDSLNDPYEYEGIRYIDDYRVCCLTKSPLQMLMWSYYGNHHECCIAFLLDENPSLIREVDYRKDYYQHRTMDAQELINNLYSKAYEWRNENEVRILYHRQTADPKMWVTTDNKVFFKAKVKQVVLGLKADLKADDCQLLFKLIRDEDLDIDIKQCMLSDDQYRIVWDKQFDYLNEII